MSGSAPAAAPAAGGGGDGGASGSGGPVPTVILIVGTAGSGKTTLVQRLCAELALRGDSTYAVNLDPAVMHLPYHANIDIRDTVNYKELMKQYKLGPNGAIVTALNLFATRFDKVVDILKERAPATRYVVVDTPGQIEVFTWSASGSLITDMLVSAFPTVVLYVVDTPRCKSPVTFMSNMLYACSILYKTRLPFVAAFNKADIAPTQFAAEWMDDYAAFQAALDEESERSESYSNSLTRSLSLSLDEFYRELRHVGVSSLTGAGFPELLGAVSETAEEFKEQVLPELLAARAMRADKEKRDRERELERVRAEVFGGEAGEARAAARVAGGGGGGGGCGDEGHGRGQYEEEEEEDNDN